MFTCGNKALVVGDSTTIVEFSFPTNDVKFNDPVSTYDRNAAVFFVIQFDGIAVEFVLFEKETEIVFLLDSIWALSVDDLVFGCWQVA